jgi:glucosamine--fructose-6-phosphate aminotransferase (isomerizing)
MGLRDEILEQPAAARRQLASSDAAIEALAARLRDDPIDSVVIAARGTSDHAAIYGQYLLGAVNRLPVALAAPSILSLYGVEPRFGRAIVIGISQSGSSPDIIGIVAAGRRQGVPTLEITNDPSSPLAEAAEFVIDLAAGPERAIAATKTYTTSLLAIARLSVALSGSDGSAGAPDPAANLAAVPDAIEASLGVEDEIAAIAGQLAAADRLVVLGRGYEYATAREWALKLKELAQVFADPYSAADFLHGPIALVQSGVPVLVIAGEGPTASGLTDVLARLAELDADSVVLSDAASLRALGRRSIALPAGLPEWLRPIVSIVPAQLFAYHLTLARGLDPEAPRYLRKVTRTT